jgi:phosphoglycerate kinase
MPTNNVRFAADCVGTVAQKAIDEMNMGYITLLENLRFHKEEETNDPEFSKNTCVDSSQAVSFILLFYVQKITLLT